MPSKKPTHKDDGNFWKGRSSMRLSDDTPIGQHHRNFNPKSNLDHEFAWVKQKMTELVSSQLEGSRKTDFERDQWKERGAILPPPPKIPLKLLQQQRKSQKMKEEKKEKQMKEMGIIVAKKSKEDESLQEYFNQLKGNRRGDRRSVGDGERGLKTSAGTFKNGVLHIGKHQIKRNSNEFKKGGKGGKGGNGGKGGFKGGVQKKSFKKGGNKKGGKRF